MKILSVFAALLFMFFSLPGSGQEIVPKGFVKGSVTLINHTTVNGFIKDNMRNKAAVVFIAENENKKITYDGDKLIAAAMGEAKYLCIRGDFFLLLCDGELAFLQKLSDASSKPVYAGTEAMFTNGTEGKPGDYYIFNKNQTQLKLVNRKNISEVTATAFTNCEAAIARAKEAGNDIALLKDAVVIFNNRNR
jgi:hypothetical protein